MSRRAAVSSPSRTARLPQVGAVLAGLVLGACTALGPPQVGLEPAPTVAPRLGSDLILGDVEHERLGGIHGFEFATTVAPTGSPLEIEASSDDFMEVASWETEPGDLSFGREFDTFLEIRSATGVAIRWRVSQVDGCGRVRATSRYSPDQRSAGVFEWRLELDATWTAEDRLRFSVETRRLQDAPITEASLTVNTADSRVRGEVLELDPVVGVTQPPIPPSGPVAVTLTNLLSESDDVHGTATDDLPTNEFRWNNQRVYWWNAQAGRWDGILPTASPPAASNSHWWLWKDLGGQPAAAQEFSARTANTPDAFWDEGCATLDVFFSRDAFGTSRFRRYAYDPVTDTYVETTPKGGVKTPLTLRGSKRVSITKTSNGYLWAAVNHDGRLLVSRSIDGGTTWPNPISVTSTAANGDSHWVSFVEDGTERVAIIATENGSAENARVHFLSIDAATPAWDSAGSWANETALLPGPEGDETADDELSAIAFEDRIYFVIETEPGPQSRRDGGPQLVLYSRSRDGQWSKHIANRFTTEVGDDRKRPVVTIDAAARQVMIGVGHDDKRSASLFYSSVDDLVVWNEHTLFTLGDTGTEALYNVRLPRQPVDGTSDLLVLVEEIGIRGEVWRQRVRSSPAETPE
jgi:hypothetical protein